MYVQQSKNIEWKLLQHVSKIWITDYVFKLTCQKNWLKTLEYIYNNTHNIMSACIIQQCIDSNLHDATNLLVKLARKKYKWYEKISDSVMSKSLDICKVMFSNAFLTKFNLCVDIIPQILSYLGLAYQDEEIIMIGKSINNIYLIRE